MERPQASAGSSVGPLTGSYVPHVSLCDGNSVVCPWAVRAPQPGAVMRSKIITRGPPLAAVTPVTGRVRYPPYLPRCRASAAGSASEGPPAVRRATRPKLRRSNAAHTPTQAQYGPQPSSWLPAEAQSCVRLCSVITRSDACARARVSSSSRITCSRAAFMSAPSPASTCATMPSPSLIRPSVTRTR